MREEPAPRSQKCPLKVVVVAVEMLCHPPNPPWTALRPPHAFHARVQIPELFDGTRGRRTPERRAPPFGILRGDASDRRLGAPIRFKMPRLARSWTAVC